MGRDQQVVRADRPAFPAEVCPNLGIVPIRFLVQRQDLQARQHLVDALLETRGTLFLGPEAELAGNDDARADRRLTDDSKPLVHETSWIPDEFRKSVGVQQITEVNHLQRSTSSSGGGSSISGKSSSRGSHEAASSNRDGLRTGSTTRRFPSLRRRASLPGSSKSRGIRNAWFRPFRNNRTIRSVCTASSRPSERPMPKPMLTRPQDRRSWTSKLSWT